MVSLFKDSIYEGMKNNEDQWLNLALEPFECDLYELLDNVPKEIEIPKDTVKNNIGMSYDNSKVYLRRQHLVDAMLSVVFDHIPLNNDDQFLSAQKRTLLESIIKNIRPYSLKIEGDVIDFDADILPKITLVKNEFEISEEEIFKNIALKAKSAISYADCSDDISQLKSIMETLEVPADKMRTRSRGKCIRSIANRAREIIENNEFNIRNSDVLIKFYVWVSEACSGNLQAAANLSILKCMVHRKQPIYSVKGVQ